MKRLPSLTGQVKPRACNWAGEGKSMASSLREEEKIMKKVTIRKGEGGGGEKKMEEEEVEDGADPCVLEEPQVARDLIAEE